MKVKRTTTEPHKYSFIDRNVTTGKYSYRLMQNDFDGGFEYSNETEVDAAPVSFSLEQNYPNPFNPNTKISWQSPVSSWQTLIVFDALGNEVAILVDEEKPAGVYELNWNAANLSSGVYFYQLKAGSFVQTRKMLLLK